LKSIVIDPDPRRHDRVRARACAFTVKISISIRRLQANVGMAACDRMRRIDHEDVLT
jgi:hypothetical protein